MIGSLRRLGSHLVALGLVVLGVAGCGSQSKGGPKVLGTFVALGDQEVVATFGAGGLARLRWDGVPAWEVATDHVEREIMSLRMFADGVVAVAGKLANGTSVVDCVGLRDGALRFRLETAGPLSLGAVATQGTRRYMFGCARDSSCEILSFDDGIEGALRGAGASEGWVRRLEGGGWGGATLWAQPDGALILGNHAVLRVTAKHGEPMQRFTTLGRTVRIGDRLVWLGHRSQASQWPAPLDGGIPKGEGTLLLAWSPNSEVLEVLGTLPPRANLLSAGRSGQRWVVGISLPGPRVSVFGLAVRGSGSEGPRSAGAGADWRVDLPEGEHHAASTPISGWMPHSHPGDGALHRVMPIASFDQALRHRLRWVDLLSGRFIETSLEEGASDLEVRRDGERFVVLTARQMSIFDALGQRVSSFTTDASLVHAYRLGQVMLSGDTWWWLDSSGSLQRLALGQ